MRSGISDVLKEWKIEIGTEFKTILTVFWCKTYSETSGMTMAAMFPLESTAKVTW